MCKIKANKDINPNFVLYNLVFSRSALECFCIEEIVDKLNNLGVEIDERHVKNKIEEWYNKGMLQVIGRYYFVA